MNYALLSSPRKIPQLPPRQPLNSEYPAAMLLVTITPWLKGVFMGIGGNGSLSHRGPVGLHAPDHTPCPLSRDVTVATRPPSREQGGPPTAAVAGPAGNAPPDTRAAAAGLPLLDAGRCPGDSAPDPPGSRKEGKLRTDMISNSPLKTHRGAAPTRTNAVAPDVQFLFPLFLLSFVWLHWVLAVAHKTFNCGMWDLVP